MTPGPNTSTWSSEAFLSVISAWVAGAADEAGVVLTGEREQPHVRPWSSAVRFGAEDGDLWFKVNGPGTRHESGLLSVLAQLEPGIGPSVLASDPARGWSLMRDAGPILRTVAPPEGQWDLWPAVLARYAEAQVRLAEHPEAVLATGLPLVTPRNLPFRLRELVGELGAVAPDDGGLTTEERLRLESRFEEYDDWCSELEHSGIPSSLQHDDLHSGNICWSGSPGSARMIDWGDASWGHPLGAMLVTLNSIAWFAKVELDDPRVRAARDAYLEPFTRYAVHRELVRYTDLARRTGCVTRALSYRAALVGEPLDTHRERDFPVRGWLLELLES